MNLNINYKLIYLKFNMKKKYSLILPCYNEYKNLRLLIPQVCNTFKKLSYELIIVDDNSEDLTIFKLKVNDYVLN